MWIGVSTGPLSYRVFCYVGNIYKWGYLYRRETEVKHKPPAYIKWLHFPGEFSVWYWTSRGLVAGDAERERADALPISSLPLWRGDKELCG